MTIFGHEVKMSPVVITPGRKDLDGNAELKIGHKGRIAKNLPNQYSVRLRLYGTSFATTISVWQPDEAA